VLLSEAVAEVESADLDREGSPDPEVSREEVPPLQPTVRNAICRLVLSGRQLLALAEQDGRAGVVDHQGQEQGNIGLMKQNPRLLLLIGIVLIALGAFMSFASGPPKADPAQAV
jgi:hypothetical protein